MADAYGPDGRAEYPRAHLTFDIAWPLVYVAFLTTALSTTFRRGAGGASRWRWVNLPPAVGGGFDLLENTGASLVMLRYPERTPVIDTLTPLATTAKWVVLVVCSVVLILGLLSFCFRWMRRGRRLPG